MSLFEESRKYTDFMVRRHCWHFIRIFYYVCRKFSSWLNICDFRGQLSTIIVCCVYTGQKWKRTYKKKSYCEILLYWGELMLLIAQLFEKSYTVQPHKQCGGLWQKIVRSEKEVTTNASFEQVNREKEISLYHLHTCAIKSQQGKKVLCINLIMGIKLDRSE